MITIPLFWWYIPVILLVIPAVIILMEENGAIDNNWLGMVAALLCWPFAAGILVTKFFLWLVA